MIDDTDFVDYEKKIKENALRIGQAMAYSASNMGAYSANNFGMGSLYDPSSQVTGSKKGIASGFTGTQEYTTFDGQKLNRADPTFDSKMDASNTARSSYILGLQNEMKDFAERAKTEPERVLMAKQNKVISKNYQKSRSSTMFAGSGSMPAPSMTVSRRGLFG